MSWQTNLNSGLTLMEGVFNIVGYLPNSSELQQNVTRVRFNTGLLLTVTSIAVSAISFLVAVVNKNYTEQGKKIAAKALFYVGQGILNMSRAKVEEGGWGALTLIYDLYNQKLLPYTDVKANFDIQSRLFAYIKTQLDRLNISQLIPNAIQKVSSLF